MDKENKKTRKQKNPSKFVKDNLDLFKEILDPNSGWMSKVKNSDGKQRYFVKRGDQMVCQLNKFFMNLLEAKVELNPSVEEKNVRRSMDINALITFFEKGRANRPGAGRKNKDESQDSKKDIFSDTYIWSDQQGKVIKGSLMKDQFNPDHELTKDCYVTLGEVIYPIQSLSKENQADLLNILS